MRDVSSGTPRFDPATLSGLEEPVRRFFEHAIAEGAPLGGTLIDMRGRVRVGAWLPFSAVERCDGRSFEWRARIGIGPLTVLRVLDAYTGGRGRTEGRLFGHLRLFGTSGSDTARSAAGRAALESVVFAPNSVLPEHGVEWRAASERQLVATFDLPPERIEVRVQIDAAGAVRSVDALRWGNAGQREFDYIRCGCEVHAEHRFGDLTLPSSLTVSWWYGTPRQAPFFEARIEGASPA